MGCKSSAGFLNLLGSVTPLSPLFFGVPLKWQGILGTMSFPLSLCLLALFFVYSVSVSIAEVLIISLDAGILLFLQNNDNSNAPIVNVKLIGSDNYKMWLTAIRIALKGKHKIGFVDGTYVIPVTSPILSQQWERSNLLAREPLPDVKEAFNVVSREESHRGLHLNSGSSGKAKPTSFVAKSNNLKINDFKRGLNSTNRGNNPNLLCKKCGLIRHTIERCSEIIGYPASFKRNPNLVKHGGNSNRRPFNGNAEAQRGASTSTRSTTFNNAFTKEQMMKILSLINENPNGNANANMASMRSTFFNGNGSLVEMSGSRSGIESQSRTNNGDEPQTVRKSSRVSNLPSKFNNFILPSNKKYGIEKHMNYSKLSTMNFCSATNLHKSVEPKSYIKAVQDKHWVEAMNNDMEALFINNTWVLTYLPVNIKTIGYLPPGYYDKSETKGVFLALLVYVDEIVVTGNNTEELEKFKLFLASKFQIKDLGTLKYFLGIKFLENKNGLCLSQRKYYLELLCDYGLLACKHAATPMQQNVSLSHEDTEKDKKLKSLTGYQKLIGKLIYLSVTRPDISYVVHCLSQHMHSPLQSHFTVGLRVLRYLKISPGAGIQFYHGNSLGLHAFSDADWAKCLATRKSILGPVWGCDRLVSRANVIENQVMAISVISVSSDSSEESVGTPAGRVILFGTIPTTIPDTTPTISPPTTHTDTTVTPTEIPTVLPTVLPTVPPSPDHTPALPDITPASPDYSPASDTESDPSEDPSSDHIPPLPAISPFLSSADDTTDSDTPDTPPSPTHGTPFTEITPSTQRSPVVPRRRVMILAPGQPIPYCRPYRYHLNGPLHMLTARKRVGPLPTHRLAVKHSVDHSSSDYFSLDDSARDSSSDSSSEASSDFHSDVSSDSSLRHSLPDHL
ncbi:ribonuclease H-like domain-containing protein [Tanacetum coccineum]